MVFIRGAHKVIRPNKTPHLPTPTPNSMGKTHPNRHQCYVANKHGKYVEELLHRYQYQLSERKELKKKQIKLSHNKSQIEPWNLEAYCKGKCFSCPFNFCTRYFNVNPLHTTFPRRFHILEKIVRNDRIRTDFLITFTTKKNHFVNSTGSPFTFVDLDKNKENRCNGLQIYSCISNTNIASC